MDQFQAYGELAQFLIYKVLALAAAIFSTMVVSQEVEQKTIVYLLTRNLPRWSILLFRSLAAIFAVILVSWFACLAGGIGVMGFSALQYSGFWRDMGIMVIGALAYCSLFIFISLLINRAMAICLLFAFGWEFIIPNLPGDLFYLSIFTYLKAMAGHAPREAASASFVEQVTGATQKVIPPGTALFVLIAFSVVILVISLLWFSRFEYSPREDGD
jgi:ABC-2 type transport system permease protein